MHGFIHTYTIYSIQKCDMYQVIQYSCLIGHIVLNYTSYFVYCPLNSYVCIHWLFDFKYILYIIIFEVFYIFTSKIIYNKGVMIMTSVLQVI